MPEIIDLIAELCFIAQNQEAVCKAFRDEELFLVLGRQGNTIPLALGLRIASEVNSNIEHSTAHSAHQLALRILLWNRKRWRRRRKPDALDSRNGGMLQGY